MINLLLAVQRSGPSNCHPHVSGLIINPDRIVVEAVVTAIHSNQMKVKTLVYQDPNDPQGEIKSN